MSNGSLLQPAIEFLSVAYWVFVSIFSSGKVISAKAGQTFFDGLSLQSLPLCCGRFPWWLSIGHGFCFSADSGRYVLIARAGPHGVSKLCLAAMFVPRFRGCSGSCGCCVHVARPVVGLGELQPYLFFVVFGCRPCSCSSPRLPPRPCAFCVVGAGLGDLHFRFCMQAVIGFCDSAVLFYSAACAALGDLLLRLAPQV